MREETDVIIIGSGFGASVAALRFAEAGKKVIVLERGGWISRENFEADDDMFWQPEKGRYGMNDFRKRGRNIVPWLGAGVGGGSHVYAATLKRRAFFDDFPGNITVEEMQPYYEKGEQMLQAVPYPNYPPYNQMPSYKIFREAEQELRADHPELVEEQGDILLGISFAPVNGQPGEKFINKYGAAQRYSDPEEQKLLGGDIDSKNTLDKNYLFLAQQKGTIIKDFAEAICIEPQDSGGYVVHWNDPRENNTRGGSVFGQVLVCGAGTVGSTQLLLQCKEVYKTLPKLSNQLGKKYSANGDYVTFMIPKKGLLLSWLGLASGVLGAVTGNKTLAVAGLASYFAGWWTSSDRSEPDKGTTNSDYIRFRHRDGSPQGAYLEGGRYPTPIKAVASVISSLSDNYRPESYIGISDKINWMGKYIPVIELLERSWPIPILMMGRDDAVGEIKLDENAQAEIDYPFDENKEYIAYLENLGRLLAERADSYFIPNGFSKLTKIAEIPHNLGGVPMGNNASDGVVDTYGRSFDYDNLLVLDASILPRALGPNPVGTILAFAERAMEKVVQQWEEEGVIRSTVSASV